VVSLNADFAKEEIPPVLWDGGTLWVKEGGTSNGSKAKRSYPEFYIPPAYFRGVFNSAPSDTANTNAHAKGAEKERNSPRRGCQAGGDTQKVWNE
jgi:hypothetical protein